MTMKEQQPDAKRQTMDNDDDHSRIDSHENNHRVSEVKAENPVMPLSVQSAPM